MPALYQLRPITMKFTFFWNPRGMMKNAISIELPSRGIACSFRELGDYADDVIQLLMGLMGTKPLQKAISRIYRKHLDLWKSIQTYYQYDPLPQDVRDWYNFKWNDRLFNCELDNAWKYYFRNVPVYANWCSKEHEDFVSQMTDMWETSWDDRERCIDGASTRMTFPGGLMRRRKNPPTIMLSEMQDDAGEPIRFIQKKGIGLKVPLRFEHIDKIYQIRMNEATTVPLPRAPPSEISENDGGFIDLVFELESDESVPRSPPWSLMRKRRKQGLTICPEHISESNTTELPL